MPGRGGAGQHPGSNDRGGGHSGRTGGGRRGLYRVSPRLGQQPGGEGDGKRDGGQRHAAPLQRLAEGGAGLAVQQMLARLPLPLTARVAGRDREQDPAALRGWQRDLTEGQQVLQPEFGPCAGHPHSQRARGLAELAASRLRVVLVVGQEVATLLGRQPS